MGVSRKDTKRRSIRHHQATNSCFSSVGRFVLSIKSRAKCSETRRRFGRQKTEICFRSESKSAVLSFVGEIPSGQFVENIGFMRGAQAWAGTIMGANGVFNEKLTQRDVAYVKEALTKVPESQVQTARAAEQPEIKNLFRIIGSDVLESLKRLLPALGLRRYNGEDFPAEYDLGYAGNVILCRDVRTDALVIVDFNRGKAPTETLIRVLHYMSWARQTLAGSKDVRGVILTRISERGTLGDRQRSAQCRAAILSHRNRATGR